ncbi:isoprenylcysteine carboxylmethyltransferase family protein [Candidatus Pacearchaeota archaeon]|nr:isoprenylcysteine carboxylmethyltransferase family protein [Candidatus Pacearchaeota archaeon]
MHWGLVRTLIVLPGTVLVFIPAVILWVAEDSKFSAELTTIGQLPFWLALLAGSIGLGLSVWTVTIFMKFGEGTPAPWDPPKKLVVRGPYRCVRNPMIIGALLVLVAEAMLLKSWPIAVWMMVFFIGNSIYFPLIEEKGLENRFADDYREYKAHVPRWIPRICPWKQANDD